MLGNAISEIDLSGGPMRRHGGEPPYGSSRAIRYWGYGAAPGCQEYAEDDQDGADDVIARDRLLQDQSSSGDTYDRGEDSRKTAAWLAGTRPIAKTHI